MHSKLFRKPFKTSYLVKSNQINTEVQRSVTICGGCHFAFMKRGGCKFEDGKTRDCPWSKTGGCSFQIGTPTQRVSTPPPPPGFVRMEATEKLHVYGYF